MAVVAQQTATDSLQKRTSKVVAQMAPDSSRLDSLKKTKLGKDIVAKNNQKGASLQKHSPRKAAYYSLMLPGLGQAYNRQYWKMPFVYGGLGAVVFFIR